MRTPTPCPIMSQKKHLTALNLCMHLPQLLWRQQLDLSVISCVHYVALQNTQHELCSIGPLWKKTSIKRWLSHLLPTHRKMTMTPNLHFTKPGLNKYAPILDTRAPRKYMCNNNQIKVLNCSHLLVFIHL